MTSIEREPAPKKRHLQKKEVIALCRRLKSIKPLDILADVVVGVEADAARETLWHCICSSVVFPDFLKQLIVGYADLYKAHH